MLKPIVRFVSVVGLTLLFAVTLIGLITPLYPPFELINHFRPFLLIAGLFLLAIGMLLPNGKIVSTAIGVTLLNSALMLLPWLSAASTTSAIAATDTLKLVSFNTLISNTDLQKAKAFLVKEKADIIVFQEFSYAQEWLLKDLKKLYPYQLSCSRNIACFMALISRRPFTNPYFKTRTPNNPPIISAVFKNKNNREFKVIGTHISWPFEAFQQNTDMKWLEHHINSSSEETIVVGDFNHTPWSWRLTRFVHKTGLKRHGTFLSSWPAHLIPVFLIDNMFSTKGIIGIDMRTGPNLNSDHLPILATIGIK